MSKTEEEELLLGILPQGYSYQFTRYKIHQHSGDEVQFTLEMRVNVCDQNNVKLFLSELNDSSHCTFNIKSGKPDRASDSDKARRVLTGFRKCCMNVSNDKENRKPQQAGKNTNCSANLKFRLDRPVAEHSQDKKDKELFPLWLLIEFVHNHSLNRAEYLRYLSVSDDTKSEFSEMFAQGLSPSTALAEVKKSIKEQHPDTWPKIFADRSKVPSIFWCHHWHRVWLDTRIGSRDGVDAFEKAQDMVKEFDQHCKQKFPLEDDRFYAKIAQTPHGQTVVVITDPFMHRVHKTIPQCGEIIFIDATANLDRNDTKLFHLMCPSVVGGLPVAEILTTREDTATVVYALELLKSVLPPGAFYGRGGATGPQLFMTDDSDCLRNSLSSAWPSAELLLCIFHVLQAQWNWLWDGKHAVEKKDKPVLLNKFKQVVYAESETELSDKLEELYADAVCIK